MEKIDFEDFAQVVNSIPASKIVIFSNTCFSGALIPLFHDHNNRIIITSCTASESTYATHRDTADEHDFNEFAFHFISALHGMDPYGAPVRIPRSSNNLITVQSAFEYSFNHDHWRPPGVSGLIAGVSSSVLILETPQCYQYPPDLASETYL
jgi:hypothetical protein